MENSLADILYQLRSPNTSIIKNAENQIEYLALNSFSETISKLSDILCDESSLKQNRQLSASLIKNWITLSDKLQNKWNLLDYSIQNDVKNKVLATLNSSDKSIRRAAGFTVAGICKLEIPQNKWPDIIPSLIENSQNENANIKIASIETLGLIMEELPINILNSIIIDQIMNALLTSIKSNIDNELIINYCLKSIEKVIPHSEKNFADQVNILFRPNQLLSCLLYGRLLCNIRAMKQYSILSLNYLFR
jgi:importin subunit beta-1